MSVFATYGVLAGSGKLDADVAAFLAATGITDATIRNALNTFVKGLKSNGIWTKVKAIYPFVGGSAGTHKWNLKDPRDLDAAFRLTFVGGVTHSANGVVGNGSTGYYNTHLNPATVLAQNSASIFVYTNTNISEAGADIGALNAGTGVGILFQNRLSAAMQGRCMNNTNNPGIITGLTDSRGFWGLSRISSANYYGVGPVAINTITAASTGVPNFDIYGLCYNSSGSATGFSTERQGLMWIADGLSITECGTLRTLVNTLQSTLGR